MRLRRHFRAWLRLEQRHRLLAGESLATLCVVRVLLYILPFRTITQWLKSNAPTEPRSIDDQSSTVAHIVNATANYVPRATCLTRSLALYTMLRRRGYSVVLKIGVDKKADGKFDAHAWVECDSGACLPYNNAFRSTPIFTLRSHQTDDHPLGLAAIDR